MSSIVNLESNQALSALFVLLTVPVAVSEDLFELEVLRDYASFQQNKAFFLVPTGAFVAMMRHCRSAGRQATFQVMQQSNKRNNEIKVPRKRDDIYRLRSPLQMYCI